MGSKKETYGVSTGSGNAGQIPESYRFVVDFSKTSSKLTAKYAATQNTQSSLYGKRPILVIESLKTGDLEKE